MSLRWSDCRQAARNGQLTHQQLLQLLEVQAASGHWQRISRWLPTLMRNGLASGERQGSAIAMAAWLQRQRQITLAQELLNLVDWSHADANAWLLRGQVTLSNRQPDLAEHHLIQALVLPDGQATAAYRLGQLHRSRGKFDQAASWFLASLRCNPEPFHIHNELQFTRSSEALLPELVRFYEALCQQQPKRALVRQLLAHYLIKKGDAHRAIEESRQAARLELGPLAEQLAPATAEPTPPDFLILGVPKGGTTAVLRWLDHLPGLWCHPRKELHFFDGRYAYRPSWYCAQFPRFQEGSGILRGEATPNYFSHPETAARVSALMPNARLVVLLRDPLARAVSWVQHLQRLEGLEGSVDDWLDIELQQLEKLTSEQLSKQTRIGTGALQDSCYDLHLQRWQQLQPNNPPLLLSSDRLFAQPEGELRRLLQFLGQPSDPTPWLNDWKPLNVNPRAPAALSAELQQRLNTFLKRHCEQTYTQIHHP